MRGEIPGLASPHPLALGLPAVYQEEDPFTVQLVETFDVQLAPIVSTLDNLAAYLDPDLAPEDFLPWLASWVAIELDESWDEGRRRASVASAAEMLRRRGTATGLADELRLASGGEVEILESGASAWSLDPSSPMPGTAEPSLVVRIRAADAAGVDVERVDRIVRAVKPAHVPHRVELVGPGGKRGRARSTGGDGASPAAAGDGEPADGDGGDGATPAERGGETPPEGAAPAG